MAAEATAGNWRKLFLEIDAQSKVRARSALTALALVVEKQAKLNASMGAHSYGTKTPSSPGHGPAVISGTLRRAITHTPVAMVAGGWETRVGMGTGFFPPYGKAPTAASKYAFYLETGLRNGSTYPFLGPAFRYATGAPARLIYETTFGTGWKTIL